MSLLRVESLQKSFGGIHAVAGVSFALAAGEIVALIGPNGAGKSTCFNLLNGQLRPDGGRILVNGSDVTDEPVRALCQLGVSRGFQVAATFTSMSVRENVQIALLSRAGEIWRFGVSVDERFKADAIALLDRVGMTALAERACGTLAYGDLKRLELAVALAGAPKLLLLDEPSAGMAAAERAAMMALIRRLADEHTIGVLFTEHNMDAVFAIADRILVMDHGALIAAGTPGEIRANRHVQAVYLGDDA